MMVITVKPSAGQVLVLLAIPLIGSLLWRSSAWVAPGGRAARQDTLAERHPIFLRELFGAIASAGLSG